MMKSSDSVKTYFNEIRSVPLMKKEEETELAKRVEDCLVAIIRKLLDTGVLIEEINKLKNVLSGMEEDKENEVRDDTGNLQEDAEDSKEILNIIEEIITLFHTNRDDVTLIYRILDADRLTGIIEKTVEKLKRDNDGYKCDYECDPVLKYQYLVRIYGKLCKFIQGTPAATFRHTSCVHACPAE